MDPAVTKASPPSEDWRKRANRGYGAKPKPNRGKKSSISIDFNAIEASSGKQWRVIFMNSPGYHSRPLLESITMWYAITGHDNPDSLENRRSARPAHLARLQVLQDAGRLMLAGPFPAIDAEDPGPAGFSGSLIVAEFSDLTAARDWADADPYVAANVYKHVDVRPFRKVLP